MSVQPWLHPSQVQIISGRGHHQISAHKSRVEERRDPHWILCTLNPGAEGKQPHPSCLPREDCGIQHPHPNTLTQVLDPALELFLKHQQSTGCHRCQLGLKARLVLLHKAKEKGAITTLQISDLSFHPQDYFFLRLFQLIEAKIRAGKSNTKVKSAWHWFGDNTLWSHWFRFQRVLNTDFLLHGTIKHFIELPSRWKKSLPGQSSRLPMKKHIMSKYKNLLGRKPK